MDTSFALTITEDDSFSQHESDAVLTEFVCAVCHGDLHELFVPNEARVLIVCFEHGNICNVGRVTRNTVSIQLERAYKNYYAAIHALPDLWPDQIEKGFTREHAINIAHANVCAVCGQMLKVTYKKSVGIEEYDVTCDQHRSVSICGYIRPDKFVFNFQAQKDWEKAHPRPRTWEITKEK